MGTIPAPPCGCIESNVLCYRILSSSFLQEDTADGKGTCCRTLQNQLTYVGNIESLRNGSKFNHNVIGFVRIMPLYAQFPAHSNTRRVFVSRVSDLRLKVPILTFAAFDVVHYNDQFVPSAPIGIFKTGTDSTICACNCTFQFTLYVRLGTVPAPPFGCIERLVLLNRCTKHADAHERSSKKCKEFSHLF